MDAPEAAARIRIELGNEWLHFPKVTTTRPKRLFHYTSHAGLLGIVETGRLWATNIQYMNDSSELDYGMSMTRSHLRCLSAEGMPGVVREFLGRGERMLDLPVLLPDRQFYAFCFCQDPDLLSQWRAYADRGGGYAIGFDTDDLTNAVIKGRLSLFPVEYGPGSNWELLVHDIGALCDALTRCVGLWPDDETILLSAACDDLRLALIFRIFWSKHPGFCEEKEWRILASYDSNDQPRIRFRQGQATLVPYVELDLSYPGGPDRLPICEVVHGPTAHPKLASQALDWLFKKHGFRVPEIRGSSIPLRV
jgi:Protein of unknown function (DUF2971)